MPDFKH